MNQANWQQVKEIFHRALAIPPAERDAFLQENCEGDEDLRQQVETLLESYESGFLEESVLDDVTKILIQSRLSVGQKLGRYEIKKQLGTGGMGEVFLAEDTELFRPVALKILHQEVADDKERISRFVQEARAASALNHPNILTIHEIGEADDLRFIVSEYIEGETLRERLKRKNLSVTESLEIAEQIATALQAAHRAGIVHRDIKPENIMLREDGFAKVLDFGLAKLTETKKVSLNPEASTLAQVRTSPGMVMGTVAYMSPEQARGQEVDQRTDIWSLGVVLYEMLSGKLPFYGDTTSDIIASILKTEVESFEKIHPKIPSQIERICLKALAKDANERYQTSQEFLQDLKQTKKYLETENEQDPTRQFYSDERKTELIRHRSTLSREYLVSQVKQHKVGFSVLLGILLLTLGIGTGSYWLLSNRNKTDSTNPANNQTNNPAMQITRLTNSGKEIGAAISPDGKYVAHFTPQADGKYSLVLRQVSSSSTRELVANINTPTSNLTFSSNGEFVYYASIEVGSDFRLGFYRVSILGGEPVLLSTEGTFWAGISFSPDGDRLAYIYLDFATGDSEVRLVSLKDLLEGHHNPQTIVTRQYPYQLQNIAWSPDGSLIVSKLTDFSSSKMTTQLIGFTPEGKEQEIPGKQNFKTVNYFKWVKQTGDLLVTGTTSTNENDQIWRLGKNGEIRRITNELNWYDTFSISDDGKAMAATQSSGQLHLYVGEATGSEKSLFFEADKFKQITSGVNIFNGVSGSSWTPDGQIIYDSSPINNNPVNSYHASPLTQIFQINSDGSGKKQLTHSDELSPQMPQVTPDGRFIIFSGNVKGTNRIFRLDRSNGTLKQLTQDNPPFTDTYLTVAPDGQYIIYNSFNLSTKLGYLRKMSIEGGESFDLTEGSLGDDFPSISPDGTLIVFLYYQYKSGSQYKLLPLSNTKAAPKLFPYQGNFGGPLRWTPDGRAFVHTYYEKNSTNLRAVPIDGSKPFNLTNFTDNMNIYAFDFSKDGKRLVISRQPPTTSDIALIKNFD